MACPCCGCRALVADMPEGEVIVAIEVRREVLTEALRLAP